jgi:hypothetical protein
MPYRNSLVSLRQIVTNDLPPLATVLKDIVKDEDTA